MEDVLDWCQGVFDDRWMSFLFKFMMLIFGVGAVVYVMNIVGLSGYAWAEAGLMPRIFDIVFFALFALVAAAIALRNPWAVPLWLLTAALQIGVLTLYAHRFSGSTSDMTEPTIMIQTQAGFLLAFAVLLVVRRLR